MRSSGTRQVAVVILEMAEIGGAGEKRLIENGSVSDRLTSGNEVSIALRQPCLSWHLSSHSFVQIL